MRNRASAQLVFRRDPSCTTPSLGLGRQPPAVLSHLGTPQVSSRAGSTSGDANFPQCERGPEACSERIGTEGVIGPRCSSARHWYSTCIGASASHLVAFMHDAEPQRMAWVEGPRPGALGDGSVWRAAFFRRGHPTDDVGKTTSLRRDRKRHHSSQARLSRAKGGFVGARAGWLSQGVVQTVHSSKGQAQVVHTLAHVYQRGRGPGQDVKEEQRTALLRLARLLCPCTFVQEKEDAIWLLNKRLWLSSPK